MKRTVAKTITAAMTTAVTATSHWHYPTDPWSGVLRWGELGTPPSRITAAQLNRVLRRYCSCRLSSARGIRRDFPNREEVVRLHRLWRRLPERFGSSTGRWHSPSRQCIQRDRIRGIRCAPEIELFLFLEPVQTGRIGDPSRLSQPTPALSPRRETGLRQMIQICNCLRVAPWSS